MSTLATRSEQELVVDARRLLEPHFHLLEEVRLRDPLTAIDLRVDLLAWPKAEDFPFDLVAVEVKRPIREGRDYVSALKQCMDYRRSVIVDGRCKRCFGWVLPAVFLFHGRPCNGSPNHEHPSCYGAIRLAGRLNIGELVRHAYDGARLEICEEPIWSARNGTTGTGLTWPRARRVGNSRRRSS